MVDLCLALHRGELRAEISPAALTLLHRHDQRRDIATVRDRGCETLALNLYPHQFVA